MNDQTAQPTAGQSAPNLPSACLDTFATQVCDAGKLLDYAIASGFDIKDEIITAIREAFVLTKTAVLPPLLDAATRTQFDIAYRDLVKAMYPVTPESIRATARNGDAFLGSEAEAWSKLIWSMTIVIILAIIWMQTYAELPGHSVSLDGLTDAQVFSAADQTNKWLGSVILLVQPFLYGALGACAYLLRRCHVTIYNRTFDPLRKAEYLNRILLGIVSGGAAALLLQDAAASVTLGVKLGSGAVGFLAGYHNDFLFTTIERLFAAVFPKVEAQRATEDLSPPDRSAAAPQTKQ